MYSMSLIEYLINNKIIINSVNFCFKCIQILNKECTPLQNSDRYLFGKQHCAGN